MLRSALESCIENGIDLEDVYAVELDPATRTEKDGVHVLYGSDLRVVISPTGVILAVRPLTQDVPTDLRTFDPPKIRGKRGKGQRKFPTDLRTIQKAIRAASGWSIESGGNGGLARVVAPSGRRMIMPHPKAERRGRNLTNFCKNLENEGLDLRQP